MTEIKNKSIGNAMKATKELQKACLEEFLPRKLDELRKLHAEIGQ